MWKVGWNFMTHVLWLHDGHVSLPDAGDEVCRGGAAAGAAADHQQGKPAGEKAVIFLWDTRYVRMWRFRLHP